MNNVHKKVVLFVFLFIIALLIFTTKSNASNTINSITIDIEIDKNGTAKVTEVWSVNLTEGTEGYKPYGNLGKCEISNFKVTDDTGKTYTTLSNWDTSKSFANKAYKCGINKDGKQVELCWGISKYGNRTYTLKYEISNFVNQYKDSQGIYFSLIPIEMEQSPKSVKITIHSSTISFNKGNSQIWAFGYPNGDIQFSSGSIVMNSNGRLPASNYMVALVKIEDGTFNTTNKVNKTFDKIYKDAMNGVDFGRTSDEKKLLILNTYIIPVIVFLPACYLIFIVLKTIFTIFIPKKDNFKKELKNANLKFGKKGLKLPKKVDIPYYRDIPADNDLFKAYWLIYYYRIDKSNKHLREGIMGAFLLKWIKEGVVTICENRKGILNIKNNNYAIDLKKIQPTDNELENELILILKEASGDNEILEPSEFKNWCYHNYASIHRWFKKILTKTTWQFGQEGLIETKFFNKKEEKIVDISMKEKAIELYGFKKYLLNYSLINEREAIEVELWEEYLIFAQLLGIADKIQEQFSKLYPDFSETSSIRVDYINIVARSMFFDGIKSADRSKRVTQIGNSRGSSYSSGSGGSSHSGGGSSSSGHSSGGGFR